MKRFVKLTQTFMTTAIMDIDENETEDDIEKRINLYIDNTPGGAETVICQGGDISFTVLDDEYPDEDDKEEYDCID